MITIINTSSEFKRAIAKERIFSIRDVITFADGTSKTLSLNDSDFVSYSINGATSSSGNFDIGAAVIKRYAIKINNENEKYSEYDFTDADIRTHVGLKLADTEELLRKGTYRVTSAKLTGITIDVEAWDYMLFFDRPYTESNLAYPATIQRIVADACRICEVDFDAASIVWPDYEVKERPSDEALTFRDIISHCAQIMCCYARINALDRLEFGWYDFNALEISGLDGGNFKNPESGDTADGGDFINYGGDVVDGGTFQDNYRYHHIYAMGNKYINTDDVIVTGVRVSLDNEPKESFLYGKEGYVISIDSNPLIQTGLAKTVAAYIGKKIMGHRFRPLSISCKSDPSIEEGDVAFVTDMKNNTYSTVITNTTFEIGQFQQINCDAQTKSETVYTRYNSSSKAIIAAKENTEKFISDYDLASQQFGSLVSNSLGMFETTEVSEIDGSKIKYMHDKPKLEDSKTIWRKTIDTFAVSTDSGKTWKGMDSAGNVLATVLTAIGINADWIKAGTITGRKIDNGNGTFTVDENGKVTANHLETSNIKITGGSFQIVSTDKDALHKFIQFFSKDIHTEKHYSVIMDDGGFYIGNNFGEGGSPGKAVSIQLNDLEYRHSQKGRTVLGAYGLILYKPGGFDEELRADRDYGLRVMNGQTFIFGASIHGRKVYCNNLEISGTKSRVVKTNNFANKLLYCYEMPSPMFGDIGKGKLDELGICYIYIENIFFETIDSDCAYDVFLQKYGQGDIWVDELYPSYFIAKGSPGLKFTWEIKAKQLGYAMERLETSGENESEKEINYEYEASAYLKNYEKELTNYE